MSQEELAERVEISVTHMSHIETGNTKLSLPVLAAIAQTLELSADELLYERPPQGRGAVMVKLASLLDDCSEKELRFLLELLQGAKTALRKHLE